MMTEREWELYRLSVVQQQPESPHKDTVIAGIRHKLKMLDQSKAHKGAKDPDRRTLRRSRKVPPTRSKN